MNNLILRHVFLVVFSLFSFVSFAQTNTGSPDVVDNPPTLVESFEIKPQQEYISSRSVRASTDKAYDSLKLHGSVWSNGEILIEGSGEVSALDEPTSFQYSVDLENRVFTLKPISEAEIEQLEARAISELSKTSGITTRSAKKKKKHRVTSTVSNEKAFSRKERRKVNRLLKKGLTAREVAKRLSPELYDNPPSDQAVERSGITTRAAPKSGWHTKGVRVRAYDPATIKLTETSLTTLWHVESSGFQRWYRAWRKNWAAYPTPFFNTHWYVTSRTVDWPWPYHRTLSPITSTNTGNYHNYDWRWDTRITRVAQGVRLNVHNSGTVTYTWSHRSSGEDHYFIIGILNTY